MADDIRKRATTVKEDEVTDEQESATTTEEPVASLDAEHAKQGGTDYWDLDDDGDWGGSGQHTTSKARRVLRRSNFEIGVAFVYHLIMMCFYILVHVYDATVFKRVKGVGFGGSFTYGGRWKYLTYLNLWVQFLYFFFCFFVDIMPYGATKVWFKKICDIVFTTIALPLSIFVVVMFWGIYFIDREMVYPTYLDKTIPLLLNHLWHTTIVIGSLLELVLVFHPCPSNWTAAIITLVYNFAYIIWMTWVFTMIREWPYPFMGAIPLPVLPVFFLTCILFALILYYIGKWLCYFRWKERCQVLAQMERKQS